MITQQQLVEDFLPYLLTNGIAYYKFQQVKAKSATPGDTIYTHTSGGYETRNQAQAGDYIVENMTDAKEQYLVKESTFHKKYELHEEAENGWKIYHPKGRVIGIEITELVLSEFNWQAPFHFEAPWKEETVVETGDYLVAPLPGKDEIYRIARKEFLETYKKE